jgi:hypothetical protein
MFKRFTTGQRNALLRAHWLRTKAQGRTRFIRREVVFSFLFWLTLTPAVEVFAVRVSSVRLIAFSSLLTLPIFLVGGYLGGRWKWIDLEKKYPEDSLPSWE